MLGTFDTYLLGWKDREFSVAGEHAAHVKEGGGGWIRPVILEDGIVVGGWRPRVGEGGSEITLEPAEGARGRLAAKIEAEVADIARFEAMEAVTLERGVPSRAAPRRSHNDQGD